MQNYPLSSYRLIAVLPELSSNPSLNYQKQDHGLHSQKKPKSKESSDIQNYISLTLVTCDFYQSRSIIVITNKKMSQPPTQSNMRSYTSPMTTQFLPQHPSSAPFYSSVLQPAFSGYTQPSNQQRPQVPQPVAPTPPPVNQPKVVDIKSQLKNIYDRVPLSSLESSLKEDCPQIQVEMIYQLLLCRYEQTIDQMAKRKRVELQEQFIQPANKIKSTLRVIVYSDAINQLNETTSSNPPTWTLTLKGKILESQERQKSFTSFFKLIEIRIPDQAPITVPQQNQKKQWVRQQNQENSGFEIKRNGNENLNVEILLYPLNQPQKYKLNKNLASILGITEGTRSQILTSFWEYIKLNSLQDKDNREYIICDENLRQIFQMEKIALGHVNMHIKTLLENQEPIRIQHTIKYLYQVIIIRTTDTPNSSIQGYDILVDNDIPFQPELMPFLASKVVTDDNTDKKANRQEHPFMVLNQKVKNSEKQIQKLIEQVRSHKAKHDMYRAYANDPSLFIETLLTQQNSLLDVINSENSWKGENPKNLKFLLKNQDIVEKQIRKYLEQKEEPTNNQ